MVMLQVSLSSADRLQESERQVAAPPAMSRAQEKGPRDEICLKRPRGASTLSGFGPLGHPRSPIWQVSGEGPLRRSVARNQDAACGTCDMYAGMSDLQRCTSLIARKRVDSCRSSLLVGGQAESKAVTRSEGSVYICRLV